MKRRFARAAARRTSRNRSPSSNSWKPSPGSCSRSMAARVLVVDDIAANVRLLEAKLAAEYFEVMSANSGQEALDLIEKQTPDIVLLDVMMPELDGFEVCKRIRANPRTRFLP